MISSVFKLDWLSDILGLSNALSVFAYCTDSFISGGDYSVTLSARYIDTPVGGDMPLSLNHSFNRFVKVINSFKNGNAIAVCFLVTLTI